LQEEIIVVTAENLDFRSLASEEKYLFLFHGEKLILICNRMDIERINICYPILLGMIQVMAYMIIISYYLVRI
jgi:hypothetical protein